MKKRATVTFVLASDGTTVPRYCTPSHSSAQVDETPAAVVKKLPKYPMVPATLLGRLAVSTAFRGQGYWAALLMDALYRTLQRSREVASADVVVDAKDAAARAFHKKYGFLELPRIERRLFLPMGTVEQLFR